MKLLLLLAFVLFLMGIKETEAVEFTNQNCIRAVIGEASSLGYEGMLNIASGIRNRGTLQGVYGFKAKHVDKEPEWVWNLARKAWKESEAHRTHIGDHWGSKTIDKDWIKTMKEKGYIYAYEDKGHVFFIRN